jgi:hypothetical protein
MTQGLPRTYPEPRWTDDLDPSGAETASDYESLVQDVMHVLSESMGSNVADPQKGVGALDYLNGTSAQLASMPHTIDAQLGEMTRIASSHTTLTQNDDGSFTIAIQAVVAGQVVNLLYGLGPNGIIVLP